MRRLRRARVVAVQFATGTPRFPADLVRCGFALTAPTLALQGGHLAAAPAPAQHGCVNPAHPRQEPSFEAAIAPPRRPPRRGRSVPWLLLVLLLAVVAAAGWIWFLPADAPVARGAMPPQPPMADVPATAPAPPGPLHPLPPPTASPVRADGVHAALVEALGSDAVARFLQTTNFAQRAVATLDNLGREHAPVAMWPVVPTPGRFTVDGDAGTPHIAVANAVRYEPFVAFVASLDAQRTVDLYRRLYPLLQQAYRELGFGDRYLNDRVVQVIDLLLATPEPAQAPEVALTEVKGPYASTQPWTRYEFVDPQWQALAAGQKMLLRMGTDNRLRLKAKLREIRAALLQPQAAARR